MQTNRHILGIDTSNYKTSVAVTDSEGNIICDFRKLLQIKKGDKGLRQSDAFFQHINNLPEMIEKAMSSYEFKNIAAVSVSTRPRPVLDSYMPVFKAGESIGKSIAASLGVDLLRFSHQEGHIEAVKYYSRLKNETDFLCFHLSGGTCELLKIGNSEIEIIGGSKDISFGQLLDRIGVGMGFDFPAGEELDKIAISGPKSNIIKKIELQGLYFNLSGVETKSLRNLEWSGLIPEVFDKISDLLVRLSIKAMEETGLENIIFTGGVAESLFIRDEIKNNVPGKVEFGARNLSSDNAIGISLLGGKSLWQ
ncbi:MAG: O-sialoglycoprotein endopeptidase [Peptostreptococcaceae bacterium]|nr:O-sialoglycoprotein endopeptidase [Peptostreptococcaceae bacterium]